MDKPGLPIRLLALTLISACATFEKDAKTLQAIKIPAPECQVQKILDGIRNDIIEGDFYVDLIPNAQEMLNRKEKLGEKMALLNKRMKKLERNSRSKQFTDGETEEFVAIGYAMMEIQEKFAKLEEDSHDRKANIDRAREAFLRHFQRLKLLHEKCDDISLALYDDKIRQEIDRVKEGMQHLVDITTLPNTPIPPEETN